MKLIPLSRSGTPQIDMGARGRYDNPRRPEMTYLDSAILDVTEYCCRKFQVLTGRTNVWLAFQLTNLSIVIYFVWAGLSFWTADIELRIFVGLFCGTLLYVLTQTILKDSVEDSERNAYRRVAKGLRNPRRIRDAMLRTSFLSLSIVLGCLMLGIFARAPRVIAYFSGRLPIALLSYLLIVLTTALLYLLACDPLPPCTGKVREWVRGRAGEPASVPQEQ